MAVHVHVRSINHRGTEDFGRANDDVVCGERAVPRLFAPLPHLSTDKLDLLHVRWDEVAPVINCWWEDAHARNAFL